MSREPRIIAFTCTYCAYAAAEAAGVSKLHYPPHIYIVRLPCSGMFKSHHVLKALRSGYDAVLWGGCHPPYDCHFVNGNYKALVRATLLKNYLRQLGFEDDRFRLEWIAAGEAERFASIAREMVEKATALPKLRFLKHSEVVD
ncbi:MAG: hydrogenase iron-sulfur subunit [Ignisphaera sp.]|nr:hydrogenase iron-sulfur subunit [Ignisphaera sp.]MDW8085364.1 hydrogenase iron-sulfur subunit [Ignisphaera sp.]